MGWLEEGSSTGLQVAFAGVGSCPVQAENFPLTAPSSGADPGACCGAAVASCVQSGDREGYQRAARASLFLKLVKQEA